MADKARGRNNWIGGRKQRIQADATVVASDAMRAAINQLNAALSTASLPFDAVDEHEYWLLDDADGAPLAQLQPCVDLEDREVEKLELLKRDDRFARHCKDRMQSKSV